MEVFHGDIVARKVQHDVLERAGVAIREHEPVAIGPVRVGRVMFHDTAVEDVAEGSERHRGALVAAVRSERAVHRDPADQRDGL